MCVRRGSKEGTVNKNTHPPPPAIHAAPLPPSHPTHRSSKHPQHILHNRTNAIRIPLLLFVRILQVRHDIHDIFQSCVQHLLLILEVGNEIIDVVDGTLGIDAAVGLAEDGGDFVFGHDEIAGGLGLLYM